MEERSYSIDRFLTLFWSVNPDTGKSNFVVENESDNIVEFNLSLQSTLPGVENIDFIADVAPLGSSKIGEADIEEDRLQSYQPLFQTAYLPVKTIVPHPLSDEVDLVITSEPNKDKVIFELSNHGDVECTADFEFTLLDNIQLTTTPHTSFELKTNRSILVAEATTNGVYRYEYSYRITNADSQNH